MKRLLIALAGSAATLFVAGAALSTAHAPEVSTAETTVSAATTETTVAATANVKVINYNLCGAAAHCDNPGEITNRTGYLIDEVLSYDADVVMLTEVCYLQYAHIRDELAAQGYGYKWIARRPMVENCTPPGGNTADLAAQDKLRFGQMLLAKNSLENREEILLTDTNYGTAAVSKALCADANVAGLGQGALRVCVAHLRAGATGPAARARWDEAATWSAEVDRYLLGAGHAVILGGDLNAEPGDPELDPFYSLEGIGEFVEIDMTDPANFTADCLNQQAGECRSGAATFDHPTEGPKKLDYVFLSGAHASNLNGEIRPSGPNSDHYLLRGSADLTVN